MQEWRDERIQTDLGFAGRLNEPPAAAGDRLPLGGDRGSGDSADSTRVASEAHRKEVRFEIL
ncbi:MAG: hypothetical protein ACI9NC_003954, partial [Verrucomicrobiales bacterium]